MNKLLTVPIIYENKFDWTPDDISIEKIISWSMGLISNSIQGHSTILCLKKEAVGL